MKKINLVAGMVLLTSLVGGINSSGEEFASPNKLDSNAYVEFKVKEIDPNNPEAPGPEEKPEIPGGDKDGNELPDEPNGGAVPETIAPLMLNFVPNFEFGSHEIKLGDQFYHPINEIVTTNNDPISHFVQVTDLRGGNKGWHLTLDTTPLSNGDNVLSGSKMNILDSTVLTNIDGITGPKSDIKTIEFGKTGQSVMTAAKGTGSGRWWTVFGKDVMQNGPVNESIHLHVPASDSINIVEGQYTSTLTWNLAGNTDVGKAATPSV